MLVAAKEATGTGCAGRAVTSAGTAGAAMVVLGKRCGSGVCLTDEGVVLGNAHAMLSGFTVMQLLRVQCSTSAADQKNVRFPTQLPAAGPYAVLGCYGR